MIHAVGTAWADKILGNGRVSLTLFGDGATSEGDFHEAMNFAGVYATPTIFFCQNNGWAISLPFDKQTAAESLVDRALGYGMPGIVVDGNDLLAVVAATEQAVARARTGDGPTFIEAITYRVGPHTTADDPGRYRTEDATASWRAKDPISRVKAYLAANDQWDEEWEREVADAASQQVEDAVAGAEALEPFTEDEVFDAMFAEPTAPLIEQRSMLRRDG
jgi:pyruvate dehydrogenase E1 component alpha subunit